VPTWSVPSWCMMVTLRSTQKIAKPRISSKVVWIWHRSDRRSLSTGSNLRMADYSSLGGQSSELPEWKQARPVTVTKSKKPDWTFGEGSTTAKQEVQRKHVEIDPFKEGRSWFHNYTLLVSGIVPRPIGFVSTISKDGNKNLAPFSYFQCVDHNPPVFIFGFTGRDLRPKDTLKNLEDTGECVINTVSEDMIEAVNATSIDLPSEASEWKISGLHQAACTTVRPPRVRESVFSIECKLLKTVEFGTSQPSVGPHGRLAIVEGTRFWVREDAIDEKQSKIDLNVLRPIGQLGGISYARVTDTFELARSSYKKEIERADQGFEDMLRKPTAET
jgi:flavin reductase (DIM6/NTAB) family NADH-FMN oxidoreductase RutF